MCEYVIEEDVVWVHLFPELGKVCQSRIHPLHLTSANTHVLPPVDPRLQPLRGVEQGAEVVCHGSQRRVVDDECDMARVSLVVRAQPNIVSFDIPYLHEHRKIPYLHEHRENYPSLVLLWG